MMLNSRALRSSCISILGLVVLVGCASPGGSAYYGIGPYRLYPLEKEHQSKLVIGPMGGVLPSEGRPALAVRIDNKSTNMVWVRVGIAATDMDPEWNSIEKLDAGRGTLFQSRRHSVLSDTEYPIVISIYADPQLTSLVEEIRTKFRFSKADLQRYREATGITAGCYGEVGVTPAEVVGKPQTGELTTLPKEFANVWYRSGDKGVSLKAYSASGKFAISETRLVFGEKDEALEIDIREIKTIGFGKLSGDSINDWTMLRYGEPEKVAGFKDGSKLGWGTDTNLICLTLKFALEKRSRQLRQ